MDELLMKDYEILLWCACFLISMVSHIKRNYLDKEMIPYFINLAILSFTSGVLGSNIWRLINK